MKNFKLWVVESITIDSAGGMYGDGYIKRKLFDTRKDAEEFYKANSPLKTNEIQLYSEFYNDKGQAFDFIVLKRKSGIKFKENKKKGGYN